MASKFIKTSDEGVARQLLSEGFILANESEGMYTFLNDRTLKFSSDPRITFSDILNI